MARDFDGTNDNLINVNGFTGLTNATQLSSGGWYFRRTGAIAMSLMQDASQDGAGNGQLIAMDLNGVGGSTYTLSTLAMWSTTIGQWRTTNADGSLNVRFHYCVTYDGGATTNDPLLYVDGTSVSVTETATPVGSLVTSGCDTLKMGERVNGGSDYDGQIQHYFQHTGILSDGEVNRAKWWGRSIGGMLAYFPFVTDKLVNDGTQSATLTATGTTVAELATPVVRPGTAMMGMGIGW